MGPRKAAEAAPQGCSVLCRALCVSTAVVRFSAIGEGCWCQYLGLFLLSHSRRLITAGLLQEIDALIFSLVR